MHDTVANSSIYSQKVKSQAIVPEYQNEHNDNPAIVSKQNDGLELKKEFENLQYKLIKNTPNPKFSQ